MALKCMSLMFIPACIALVGKPSAPILGFSTWNYFGCNVNETIVKEVVDALISTGLRDVGYTYVNIDDWSVSECILSFCIHSCGCIMNHIFLCCIANIVRMSLYKHVHMFFLLNACQ